MSAVPDLPEPVPFDPETDDLAALADSLPSLPPGFMWGLEVTATAEVVRPEHADECVQIHPGEPCPGYPHEETPWP